MSSVLNNANTYQAYCGLLWTIVAVDYCSEWIIINSTELVAVFLYMYQNIYCDNIILTHLPTFLQFSYVFDVLLCLIQKNHNNTKSV